MNFILSQKYSTQKILATTKIFNLHQPVLYQRLVHKMRLTASSSRVHFIDVASTKTLTRYRPRSFGWVFATSRPFAVIDTATLMREFSMLILFKYLNSLVCLTRIYTTRTHTYMGLARAIVQRS